MALPLVEIVALANVLAEVSGKLFKTYQNRKRTPMPDAGAAPETQMAALREHVQQLEATQEKQAELALQMSEQLQRLTVALARLARLTRIAITVSCLAAAASVWILVAPAA